MPADDESNMVHHMMWEGNGTGLNICEIKVKDIMPERFIELLRNQKEALPQYNHKVHITPVDRDGDF